MLERKRAEESKRERANEREGEKERMCHNFYVCLIGCMIVRVGCVNTCVYVFVRSEKHTSSALYGCVCA